MAVERISELAGTAMPIRGDSIDTDRIIPARFLRSVSFEGLETHLFEDDRQQLDAVSPGVHPLSNPAYRGASMLPPMESGSIIRLALPVGALPQYGLPIPGDVVSGMVDADLLVAQDGVPRAIRLVRDNTTRSSAP